MATAISRKQFLRGDFTGKDTALRPPWADSENIFLNLCNRCSDCIDICPASIIQTGPGRYPVIDFTAGECLFCGDCANTCKTGALKITDQRQPWALHASIDNTKCLAYRNVECRSCYDPCTTRAINMTPRYGGVSIPLLDNTLCTGCGACFSVCPAQAISFYTNPSRVAS